MNDSIIMIDFCVNSEKEDASISFGAEIDLTDNKLENLKFEKYFDMDLMGEAFWENCFEFENGANKAKTIIENNPRISIDEALHKIFGKFKICCFINDEEIDISKDLDVNNEIFTMIKALI